MKRPRLVALAAVVILSPPLLSVPANAEPSVPQGGEVRTVTLITGDRVTVRGDRVTAVSMHAKRKGVRYWQHSSNGHDFVVPLDAARAVASGQLDERLFDVTGLVQQGYDDQRSRELPVIVSVPPGAMAVAPASANLAEDLTAIGKLALTVEKDRADDFWATAGDQRIWLDGKVTATLDQSVPQIGAPRAWQAGYRADGVKVAVLDTGVDAAHPDVAKQVEATANFSRDPDAKDGSGHGTHVASTIAGTGGRYQGVAPGARLLVGKVLDSRGSGTDSSVLAGMQWAVQQGARVVNMSLGSYPSDGTDPVAQTLDELSESSGVLFVVSAGNSGQDETVSSPGSADRALTVGSVTKSGQLSHFSSRGPRRGNYGLKPEISAPGSDIVAARAAGTLAEVSVDERYAKLSGTSMAAPHVAGAAAIVAGQHPEWKADQIKAALVSSAKTINGANVFGQGAGQVGVARAVLQRVRVEPAVLGLGELPSDAPVTSRVKYVNDGDQPAHLKVEFDVRYRNGDPAPAGLFTVDGDRVVVPAKGSTEVPVRVTPKAKQAGQFVGTLKATGGQVSLVTPVAVALAAEKHKIVVRFTDRNGNPTVANLRIQNETTGQVFGGIAENTYEAQVPAGRYRVLGQVTDDSWNFSALSTFAKRADVSGDTEVTIDAASAKPVTISVDDPTARPDPSAGGTGVLSEVDSQSGRRGAAVFFGGGVGRMPMYAVASETMPGLGFGHVSQWQLPWTTVTVNGAGGGYEIADGLEQSKAGWRGTLTGALVDVGDASGDPGDLRGRIPLLATTTSPPDEEMAARVRKLKEHGAQIVLAFNYVEDLSVLPVVQLYDSRIIARLRADLANGPVTVKVEGRRDSPYSYFNAAVVDGKVPDGHEFRFSRDKMSRVDANFASVGQGDTFNRLVVTAASPVMVAGFEVNTRWPQRRTDYYSPGFTWQSRTGLGFDPNTFQLTGAEITAPINLSAGQRRSTCMYCAPFGPELAQPQQDRQTGKPLPWAYREGDKLTFAVPMFGSNDPATFSLVEPNHTGTTVLSRDGKQIGRNNVPGIGVFDVPRGTGRYQLVAEAARTAPEWPLSVRTKAEWSFLAQSSNGRTVLPLLDVRFDLPLDGANSGPAGDVTGSVSASHQQGAARTPLRRMTVEVSYDDGATWRSADVARDGDRWKVRIPGGSGFASLRASATDVLGNTVIETMIRAYRVSG